MKVLKTDADFSDDQILCDCVICPRYWLRGASFPFWLTIFGDP